MNVFGWVAMPAEHQATGHTALFQHETHALNHAREQARLGNKPWHVYKVVQSHFIRPLPVQIEEVAS